MKTHHMKRYVLIALTMLALSVTGSIAAEITGTVKFTGKARSPRKIDMKSDKVCAGMHAEVPKDEKFVCKKIGEGDTYSMANVFVWVKSGLTRKDYPVPNEPVVLDQKECRYEPHVLGMRVGQELHIKNSDPTMHNVHSRAKKNRQFNNGMPQGSPLLVKKFERQEVMVKMECDAHKWMRSYIGVVSHPFFAVTDEDGNFSIKDLPAGTYEIQAWHELLKKKTQSVTIGDTETKTIDFTYTKPSKKK